MGVVIDVESMVAIGVGPRVTDAIFETVVCDSGCENRDAGALREVERRKQRSTIPC
jgi:hypothetical protein